MPQLPKKGQGLLRGLPSGWFHRAPEAESWTLDSRDQILIAQIRDEQNERHEASLEGGGAVSSCCLGASKVHTLEHVNYTYLPY